MKHMNLLIVRSLARFDTGTGIQRSIRYKAQATRGNNIASNTGGQVLRRVTFGLNLAKETYMSNEKTGHQQDQDARHGPKSTKGPISGELSPGTYADFMDALLRRARTAVTAITGASITIAVSGSEYTITRGAGSFLTDGIKKGMVIRLTAGSFNANNLNKNIVVRLVTATVITGKPLNPDLTLTAEGPIASATVTIPGKYSYAPSTGHLLTAFTFEDWHPNLTVTQSERHIGCEMNSMKVAVPETGMNTIDWDVMGINYSTATTVYFASPTAETTTGVAASASTMYIINDTYQTNISNLDFTVAGNLTAPFASGSNMAIEVFSDKIIATGNMSQFWQDSVLRDAFVNETELGIIVIMAESPDADADFISFMMPRCKLMSNGKDDPNTGIRQGITFKALRNHAGGTGIATEQTTFAYQDSAAA